MQTTWTARCFPADRFPGGVSGAGREPSAVVGASSAVRPSRATKSAVILCAKSATTADPYPRTNSHLKGDSPLHAPTRPLAAPLAARRFPLAATRVPTRAFHVPTGNTSGATGNSCGDSRFRLGARGGNSPGRLGHQGGASRRGGRRLAAASRPGRGRLAAASRAAPPLPPRSPPAGLTLTPLALWPQRTI